LAGSITSAFREATCGPICVHCLVPADDGWIAARYRHNSNPVNLARLYRKPAFPDPITESRSAANAWGKEVMTVPRRQGKKFLFVI
jgi:hypothetical protein